MCNLVDIHVKRLLDELESIYMRSIGIIESCSGELDSAFWALQSYNNRLNQFTSTSAAHHEVTYAARDTHAQIDELLDAHSALLSSVDLSNSQDVSFTPVPPAFLCQLEDTLVGKCELFIFVLYC